MTNSEKIKAKIQKLLNLAYNRAATPAEANNALLKARELLSSNGLFEHDVVSDGKQEVVERIISEVPYAGVYSFLLGALSEHYPVYTVVCKRYADDLENYPNKKNYYYSNRKSFLIAYGYKDVVDTFASSCIYICNCFDSLFKKYLSKKKSSGYRGNIRKTKLLKNDYLLGFVKGLKEALAKQEQALMIITDCPQEVTEYVFNNIKVKGNHSNSINMSYNADAVKSGFRDGQSVNEIKNTLYC